MSGPHRKPGPKTRLIADLMAKWGLSRRQAQQASHMELQLNACADDSARRLLLGIGLKHEMETV
jgi:hypothetical protein